MTSTATEMLPDCGGESCYPWFRRNAGGSQAEWLLHSDHACGSHPLPSLAGDGAVRSASVELRLFGCDPDEAVLRAREAGAYVVADAADKLHGLREAYIGDPDGYNWVSDVPLR